MDGIDNDLVRRIHRDLADHSDEELELELEDRTFEELQGDPAHMPSDRGKKPGGAPTSASCFACRANW